jgi:4-hydroxybenzoate polyprenyltransferase
MMGRALLIVGAMSTLGLIAAAVVGYTLYGHYSLHGPTDPNMPRHVLIALASSLLLLFSHCWIMFYLIGTGKAIKDAVRENGLDPAIIEETKRFKNESYPSLMLAMGLVMATFIVGGGVATGSISSWIHHVLFYLAVASQAYALWKERRALTENERLMESVDRRLAASPARVAAN